MRNQDNTLRRQLQQHFTYSNLHIKSISIIDYTQLCFYMTVIIFPGLLILEYYYTFWFIPFYLALKYASLRDYNKESFA